MLTNKRKLIRINANIAALESMQSSINEKDEQGGLDACSKDMVNAVLLVMNEAIGTVSTESVDNDQIKINVVNTIDRLNEIKSELE